MRKCLLIFLWLPILAFSQSVPSISETVKEMKSFPGYLPFYWDSKNGKVFLEINKLDSELLYQTSLPAGLGSNDLGLDRGLMGSTSIIRFQRIGNKILMIQPNYSFRANTSDPFERRAVEQSFASSTLWGFTISAESKGAVLVDATAFLLSDAMRVSNVLSNNKQGNYSIDLSRSAIFMERSKNFPMNTELEATVTYTTKDAKPGNFVAAVTPSYDAITLRIHHSFVQLPDNKYIPRPFDPRSGFIPVSYYDYASPVSEPIEKFFIIRHRLDKKDPRSTSSEPVKPIIYYLDNGTPEPIRSALLEGASWWNQAFEAAGYKNAFQVKILPDSADPMDIRYNMINWVHRSTRGWSYGASVIDPRTGEIIKGNVTLGSLRVRQDYLIAQGLLAPFEKGTPTEDKMLKMALQRLKQLAAHEVGHTLGLMHNYISSTQGQASVMDYPSPVVQLTPGGEIDLDHSYTNEIGAWDKVSIAYGYEEFPKGTNEAEALNSIIVNAARHGLTFISDRDARDPAGLHPAAHLWDVGTDPVSGLKEIIKIRQKALARFGENNIKNGTPMAMLEDVLVPVYLFHRYQLEAVTKQVGGMDYSYALRGDGQLVTKPLTRQAQLNALRAIRECLDPGFLALPDQIIRLIPPRPAGFEYSKELFNHRTGQAFDPLAAAETAADYPLTFLFNPLRLNRMVQYQQENNGLGIEEMVTALIDDTWKTPHLKGLQELIRQQNGQLLLSHLMSSYNSDQASFASKAALLKAIYDIKSIAESQVKTDRAYKGYFLMTLDRIKNMDKATPFATVPIPPGSPIGCEE